MDEENKQVTADEVYSYGEQQKNRQESRKRRRNQSRKQPDQRIHRIINSYIRTINTITASSTAGTEMSSQTTLQWT